MGWHLRRWRRRTSLFGVSATIAEQHKTGRQVWTSPEVERRAAEVEVITKRVTHLRANALEQSLHWNGRSSWSVFISFVFRVVRADMTHASSGVASDTPYGCTSRNLSDFGPLPIPGIHACTHLSASFVRAPEGGWLAVTFASSGHVCGYGRRVEKRGKNGRGESGGTSGNGWDLRSVRVWSETSVGSGRAQSAAPCKFGRVDVMRRRRGVCRRRSRRCGVGGTV